MATCCERTKDGLLWEDEKHDHETKKTTTSERPTEYTAENSFLHVITNISGKWSKSDRTLLRLLLANFPEAINNINNPQLLTNNPPTININNTNNPTTTSPLQLTLSGLPSSGGFALA